MTEPGHVMTREDWLGSQITQALTHAGRSGLTKSELARALEWSPAEVQAQLDRMVESQRVAIWRPNRYSTATRYSVTWRHNP